MKKSTGRLRRPAGFLRVAQGMQSTDILYLTGFPAAGAAVCLTNRGRLTLVVPPLEWSRAARMVHAGVQVWCSERWTLPRSERGSVAAWAVALLKEQGQSAVRVGRSFPFGLAEQLRRRGMALQVDQTEDGLPTRRAVKKPHELACLVRAQRAAVAAMRVAARVMAEAEIDAGGILRWQGKRLDAGQIRFIIEETLLRHDCTAERTIVAPAPQSADPHEEGSGRLSAGVPVVIDVFPRHRPSGYWGDLTRTLVRGQPEESFRALFAAVKEAQQAALRRLRPRVKTASVHAAAQEVFARLGFRTQGGASDGGPSGFIHSTGHGVGLDIHEAPALGLSPGVVRRGQVVTVEPGLYYPGRGGVRIEDTVVVTGDGWRPLCRCPLFFPV